MVISSIGKQPYTIDDIHMGVQEPVKTIYCLWTRQRPIMASAITMTGLMAAIGVAAVLVDSNSLTWTIDLNLLQSQKVIPLAQLPMLAKQQLSMQCPGNCIPMSMAKLKQGCHHQTMMQICPSGHAPGNCNKISQFGRIWHPCHIQDGACFCIIYTV